MGLCKANKKTSSSILQPPQIHHPSIHFIQRNSCSKSCWASMYRHESPTPKENLRRISLLPKRRYENVSTWCVRMFFAQQFHRCFEKLHCTCLVGRKTSRISVHLSGWREKRDVCFPGGGFPPESVYVSLGVFQNFQNNCQTHNTTCSSFHFNCIPPLRRHFLTLFLGDQILSMMLIVIHTVEEFQIKYFRLFV